MTIMPLLLLATMPQQVDVHLGWGGTSVESSPNDSASLGTDAHVQPSGSGVEPPTSLPAPESVTAVCQCQGHKRDVCKCLKAGVKCHCTKTSGSVWELSGGQWIKTGAKADPRRETSQTPSQEPGAVTLRSDGRWYWNDGSGWRSTSSRPQEGMRFADGSAAFIYQGGRMVPESSRMAIEIKPSGHWEYRRQCFGNYCRNVRVWVSD